MKVELNTKAWAPLLHFDQDFDAQFPKADDATADLALEHEAAEAIEGHLTSYVRELNAGRSK